jgi:hypothetical protein
MDLKAGQMPQSRTFGCTGQDSPTVVSEGHGLHREFYFERNTQSFLVRYLPESNGAVVAADREDPAVGGEREGSGGAGQLAGLPDRSK